MGCLGSDFETAPLNSNGNDGADLLGGECCYDDVGAVSGVFGLYFNVECGFGVDDDFRGEFDGGLVFFVFEEPTKNIHVFSL
jgi:hypothetical protein